MVIPQPTPQYGQTLVTGRSFSTWIGATSALSTRAPVGQRAMHSPQETHVDSPIGRSVSNAIRAAKPLPVRPITSFTWIQSHPRMQRSHRMHALWSTAITGELVSNGACEPPLEGWKV